MERHVQEEDIRRDTQAVPESVPSAAASGGTPELARTAMPRATREARARRLPRRDRELLALLGLCRYLTVSQVVALEPRDSTEKAAGQRLRRLAAEARPKGWPFTPPLLKAVPYRSFGGEPLRLWGLTPSGYAVAAGELHRVLKAFRTDVGAVFAEHFAFLTDLFVQLVRPHVSAGVLPRALPFRWNVAEDVELPWRDKDEAGCEKARVIRPDAVLEVPAAQRRFFIECEMGTHTLTPLGPDKPQATVRKLERYDAYVSGFADVPARLSHYRRKYPDGWPCEVVFLVRTEGRRDATNAALRACLENLAGTRLTARAFTLEEAAAHCAAAMKQDASKAPAAPAPGVDASPPFYGEREHAAVKDFVLDMTAALAEANLLLRRHGLAAVPGPASKAPMLEFLRKAQAEMRRVRGLAGSVSGA
jgi:Replication-relaxation